MGVIQMKRIFDEIMSRFDNGDSKHVASAKTSMIIAGYIHIDKNNDYTTSSHPLTSFPFWQKTCLYGYVRVKHDSDNEAGDVHDNSWTVSRIHHNGGIIQVSNITLDQALNLKLPIPVHENGTPLKIIADDINDLDSKWFHATRATTGNGDLSSHSDVVSIDTEKARRIGNTSNQRKAAPSYSEKADVIPLFK